MNEHTETKINLNSITYDHDQIMPNSLKRRMTRWANKLKEKVRLEIEALAKDETIEPGYTMHLCKAYKKYLTILNSYTDSPTASNFQALEENINNINGVRCNCFNNAFYEDDFEYE